MLVIQPERIRQLNDLPLRPDGDYVLYWMQASQRHVSNHALEFAVDSANEQGLPLVVVFGLTDSYPEANLRHYQFMVEGLRDVDNGLKKRDIPFRIYYGSPEEVALERAERAAMVVADRGYLRHQKMWRKKVADGAGCPVVQIESDVLVPIESASSKEEYAARTLRPKIHREMKSFLQHLPQRTLNASPSGIDLPPGLDPHNPEILQELGLDRTVPGVDEFTGGFTEGARRLKRFLDEKLDKYAEDRNDITASNTTELSPYLHFGQISPLYVVTKLIERGNPGDANVAALIEEMIVRRELAINFVEWNPEYDSYTSLPEWARETLDKHRDDEREFVYDVGEFEEGRTHDPYWNAAMQEMRVRGFMKGYMRMYWGKKVLEWSHSPERAYETLLYLNNKYFLDGRDPNSYANVAWIFGKHDRPWGERPVYGTVRYMNANGLKRKFDVDGYVEQVRNLG